MKTGIMAAGLAALTLATAPVAANAAQRTAANLTDREGMAGENSGIYLALGAVAVIAGIIILTDGDDDDLPVSP